MEKFAVILGSEISAYVLPQVSEEQFQAALAELSHHTDAAVLVVENANSLKDLSESELRGVYEALVGEPAAAKITPVALQRACFKALREAPDWPVFPYLPGSKEMDEDFDFLPEITEEHVSTETEDEQAETVEPETFVEDSYLEFGEYEPAEFRPLESMDSGLDYPTTADRVRFEARKIAAQIGEATASGDMSSLARFAAQLTTVNGKISAFENRDAVVKMHAENYKARIWANEAIVRISGCITHTERVAPWAREQLSKYLNELTAAEAAKLPTLEPVFEQAQLGMVATRVPEAKPAKVAAARVEGSSVKREPRTKGGIPPRIAELIEFLKRPGGATKEDCMQHFGWGADSSARNYLGELVRGGYVTEGNQPGQLLKLPLPGNKIMYRIVA